MKKKLFTIAIAILAISLWTTEPAFSQKDDVDQANLIDNSIGCYTTHVLDCGFDLGQQLFCNFTGVYGPPYRCTSFGCYGSETNRRCVSPASFGQ